MKNIAIFVSGQGLAAERIVRLFNEGNRLKTALVITDDSASSLLSRLQDIDVTVIHIPDAEWHEKAGEVATLLRDNEVRLIVLDNFRLALADEVLEATDGEMVKVSSPEMAPREVVAALEAELRKPVNEQTAETPEDNKGDEGESTPESEWAEALKIQFTPPRVPTTPPEVPESVDSSQPQSYPQREFESQYHPHHNQERYHQPASQRYDNQNSEPMPSTWLIWSVLVTVFCCFIPGIIAIIFSSQVSSRYYAGDIEGAKRASRQAEIWIIVSVVLGVLAATLYLPFMFIGG